MHAGLGCRRGTRAVPFSVSHALPHTVKKSLFKKWNHFRMAEMCGRTNGFSDQVIWFASMPRERSRGFFITLGSPRVHRSGISGRTGREERG